MDSPARLRPTVFRPEFVAGPDPGSSGRAWERDDVCFLREELDRRLGGGELHVQTLRDGDRRVRVDDSF